MTSSGTYNFQLSNADVVMEAFDRCEIRPPAITGDHMISANRSLNLELERWANLGVNLWAVDLQTLNLVQGVTTYNIPPETVSLLDVYLRTYTLQTLFNVTPMFSTTIGLTAITINIGNHGLVTGNYINIVTPISVGGLLLSGFYQVTSVINTNTFTIAAASAATGNVSNGGTVPTFTATSGSSVVSVNMPNHGLAIGQVFIVGVTTIVGGITISSGSYTVTGVTDVNNFSIQTLQNATSNQTNGENNGFAQIQGQTLSVDPIDKIMEPLGRTDYAMIPDKLVQGTPTQYWFNRTINPSITIWQVPDQNGPYQLQYYRMRRIQDASATMGQTPDIPYRFIDALCARLAARLAMKYAKDMLQILGPESKAAWEEAAIEDRERADIYIRPDLSGYYRDV